MVLKKRYFIFLLTVITIVTALSHQLFASGSGVGEFYKEINTISNGISSNSIVQKSFTSELNNNLFGGKSEMSANNLRSVADKVRNKRSHLAINTTNTNNIKEKEKQQQDEKPLTQQENDNNKATDINLNKYQGEDNTPKRVKDKTAYSDLKKDSSISHWMMQNRKAFEEVLKETARKSKTRWITDEVKKQSVEDSEKLKEAENASKPVSKPIAKDNKYHIVKAKETLFSIAKMYGLKVIDLKELNNLTSNNIDIGQKLLIKPLKDVDSQTNPKVKEEKPKTIENKEDKRDSFTYPKYKYYKAERGDTLYSIRKQFGMSRKDMMALNNMDKPNVYPGMVLKVYANYSNDLRPNKTKFDWPLVGRLLVGFGPQKSGIINEGINILARAGSPVKSIADGVVIYVGHGIKGYGNLVLIQHPNDWISIYARIDKITVKKGDEIKQGQVFARVEKGTRFRTSQLHFELRKNIKPQDPLEYLNSYT